MWGGGGEGVNLNPSRHFRVNNVNFDEDDPETIIHVALGLIYLKKINHLKKI